MQSDELSHLSKTLNELIQEVGNIKTNQSSQSSISVQSHVISLLGVIGTFIVIFFGAVNYMVSHAEKSFTRQFDRVVLELQENRKEAVLEEKRNDAQSLKIEGNTQRIASLEKKVYH